MKPPVELIKENASAVVLLLAALVFIIIYMFVYYHGAFGYGPLTSNLTNEVESLAEQINDAFK